MSSKDEASPEREEAEIDKQETPETETAKRKTNGFTDEEKVKRQKIEASPSPATSDDSEESAAEEIENNHHSDCDEPEKNIADDVKSEESGKEDVQSPSNEDTKEPEVEQDASTTADVESNPAQKSKPENDRKVQNLRKNIKDVIDESQLDETTLVAQRQESERLARLQEQQRLIRETQRQQAADKQANKTQQKVLSLLQGETPANSSIDFNDPIFEKLNFNPAISITPAAKETLSALQQLISTEDHIPDSASDSDDDVVIQPDQVQKPVVIDSSSDSDDCVILSSDEDEEELPEEDDEDNSGSHANDAYNVKDSEGRVVVNIGQSESKPIYIAPQLARVIKPHQIGGIRFLFDNIIENVDLFDKSSGFGCILAHSMGLGKTLQLVCFCDIFLRHTSAKKIIIIMPINTLQNWLNEFNMWLPLPENAEKSPLNEGGEVRPRHFNIFVLNDSQKTLAARAKTVIEWSTQGGVLLLGYEMYRLLSLRKTKKKKGKGFPLSDDKDTLSVDDQDMFDKINRALVNPGPDLVVCDEGHRIKNAHATTSVALKQIKTKRRVVLTGYPLQNNLLEYWCMVDFTRPSYLGTKTEFCNMFERPIQNGQCIDSTPQDCKLMRYRAHVLHSLLKGFVQRRSQTVLQKSLPDKTEFVLMFRMTEFQRKLYTVFMNEVVRSKKVPNPLKAFAVCCKIWNHPDVLHNFLKKRELDLDIELEEAESVGKGASNTKRKVRKGKDQKLVDLKSEANDEKESQSAINKITENLKTIATTSSIEKQTPSMSNVLSNDSNYSTNCKSFDSSSGSLNSYAGFQSYDSSSSSLYNQNGYQNWSEGGYWQNNYYHHSEYTQSYNQGQSSYPPYYPSSSQPEFVSDSNSKLGSSKYDPGLLADVIKEETLVKNNKNLDDLDKKDAPVSKNSRDDGIPYDWALELMKDYIPNLLENSPKLEVFFTILNETVRMGDRLLVFSQSLLTLNLMEKFLQRNKIPNSETLWAKNTSYFRLDGTTAALEREKLINEFNANDTVKLFLVSTRAGSLGINLVGANRVIVFDASWNPCHDTQAVCRVYRYGQTKSCYVYRFVMDNCLEKKIYDRQINKQGMSDRIVDECNPDAHLSLREVTSLCYDDGVDPEVKDFSLESHKYEDMVSKKVLELHSKSLTKEPFKQESLLVDRKEKKLSQAEKRLAQKGYEMEKQAATKPFGYNSVGSNYRPFRPDTTVHRPFATPRSEHSEYSDASSFDRPNNPRPNRWVPVEVWQSKGLTAQEMTLPQDVSIQTNSADKSKIYLKAGQKVIVLKSPKGICLQLESGKVIAIRASAKTLQPNSDKLDNFSALKPNLLNSNLHRAPLGPPQNSGDIIDISNDDDDDDVVGSSTNKTAENIAKVDTNGTKPIDALDQPFKEKTIYKPNLVKRRPKAYPSLPESSQLGSFDMTFHNNKAQEWNSMKPYTLGSSQSQVPSNRASTFMPSVLDKPDLSQPYGPQSYPPASNEHAPFVGAPYGQQSSYQPFQQSYSQPPEFGQYNSNTGGYSYNSYPNNSANYMYPVQENYDTGYNMNYNQTAPKHSYKFPDATADR